MASLPVLSGREVVKAFESFGWSVARQSSSHVIMTKHGETVTLSVPDHRKSPRAHFAV
jgi:predicted RNA binding protein YcfA (HicA-like mRNA interferase family)